MTAARQPLADDTPLDIEQVQTEIWRRMELAGKVALVSSICAAVHQAAMEGIARQYPNADPRERFLRLAMLRLGRDLAIDAFPDARHLDP